MEHLSEPARDIPICYDCDLVVVGGSCTGVFAAVRAARLGLRVALLETANRFGGVAVNALVNVWHSRFDDRGEGIIIAGLTKEVCDRLNSRGALIDRGHDPSWHCCFNAAELACELDVLVAEHPGIRPFLHTRMVAARSTGTRVDAVVIEDVGGRRAITCRAVVDATGNADVLRRIASPSVRRGAQLQPSTMAAVVAGDTSGNLAADVFGDDSPLPRGFLWAAPIPGAEGVRSLFGTRVPGTDCADADGLTRSEIEGRRQVRAMVDRLRQVRGAAAGIALVALPSTIGVRETVHGICHHQLSEQELLSGHTFPDTIAHGTYRVDIHLHDRDGVLFRYLDGREVLARSGLPPETGRWRPEQAVNPLWYNIPYRSLVPQGLDNCWLAGRHIDTDAGAHGAVRVMVTCNQMGEAAGVAAALALESDCAAAAVDAATLRQALNAGGSALQGV